MKITMIGTGYVGLVSGACFSDFGHVVTCVDKAADKIDTLRSGGIPIYEPGLQQLVARNVTAERLYFDTESKNAIRDADVIFIAVGTPMRADTGHADLSYVYAAAKEIAQHADGFTVVVNKSTVPVGTGDEVEAIILKERPDADFAVVSNPEFLREGAAIEDFKRPDRVVIGTDNERAREVLREVYRPLFINETPILVTERRTAEVIKYAGNAFLATKVTFINEMADLCEKVGADVQQVARGIGLDKRIGSKFLHAGPGYGGSCFPKDTQAIAKTAEDVGTPLKIVQSVIDANTARKKAIAPKVIAAMGGDVSGKTIALLGLAFKPNTDDMRDAPSLDIIAALLAAGAKIRAFDPKSMDEAREMLDPAVEYCENAYDACEGADALVIVTEWDQFRALDLERIKSALAQPNVFDLRNIYRPDAMKQAGFIYEGIGRGAV